MAEAERRVAEGDGEGELIEVPLGILGHFYYTPASLISNGGADTNSDHFRWLPLIDVPILIVHATRDAFSLVQQPALTRDAAIRSTRTDLVYVEGADHTFTQRAGELADIIDAWLLQVLAAF
jgi:pimeloyl-ACP methyl ester carboxylesterase